MKHYYNEMAIIADELTAKGFQYENESFIYQAANPALYKNIIVSIGKKRCSISYAYYSIFEIKYSEYKSINKTLAKIDALLIEPTLEKIKALERLKTV